MTARLRRLSGLRRDVLRGVVLLTALVMATVSSGGRAEDELVVGAAVPMTGAFAASGIQYLNALRLAQDDINAAGGINGRKLRIAFEDTQGNNSAAVNAFVKLVQQYDPPFVFLSSLSTQVLATEPEVLKARIPTVTGGGAVAIGERHDPYIFRIRPPDNLQSGAIAYGVVDVLKKQRPGILYAQDDYGTGAAKALETMLIAAGAPAVAKQSFSPRDNDFSAQLLALKSAGADVLVSINYNRDGALILKQRRGLGIDLPLIAGSGMMQPTTLALVEPEDLVGVIGTTDAILGAPISKASADFVERYTAAFDLRPDPFGAAYYDAAMMVADGLRKVGPDREKLRAYLADVQHYVGVTRTYAIDPATNDMAHGVVLAGFAPGTKNLVLIARYPDGVQASRSVGATTIAPTNDPLAQVLQLLINAIALGAIYAAVALAFEIAYESTGVVNFATGQLVTIGALLGVSAIAFAGKSIPLAYVLVLGGMVIVGLLFFGGVFLPLRKRPVVTVVIGTVAVGIAIQNVAQLIWGPLPRGTPSPVGSGTVHLLGATVPLHALFVIGTATLLLLAVYLLLYRSTLGSQLRALAQDPEAARLMGIRVTRLYALTWILVCLLAGCAGLLLGPMWFIDTNIGDGVGLKAFAAAIIGGFGSIPGAIIGGLLVGAAEIFGASYISSAYKDALVFALMFAFLLVRPQGLFGERIGDRA